jgi:hypothetical protein
MGVAMKEIDYYHDDLNFFHHNVLSNVQSDEAHLHADFFQILHLNLKHSQEPKDGRVQNWNAHVSRQ